MSHEHKKFRIENLFKSNLKNNPQDPGDELWNEIEENIPERPSSASFFYSRRLILALIIICLLPILYLIFDQVNWSAIFKSEDTPVPHQQQMEPLEEKKSEFGKRINISPEVAIVEPEDATVAAQQEPVIADQKVPQRKAPATATAPKAPATATAPKAPSSSKEDIDAEEPIFEFIMDDLQISFFDDSSEDQAPLAPEYFNPIPKAAHTVSALTYLPHLEVGVEQEMEAALSAQDLIPFIDVEEMIQRPKARRSEHTYPHFIYRTMAEPMFRVHETTNSNQVRVNDRIINLGLSAGVQLNKHWSFSTGLGSRNHDLRMRGMVYMTYSTDNVNTDAQGRQTGSYLISPEDNPSINLRSTIVNSLMYDGEDIENGDQFGVDISGTYRLKYHSIPAWIRYEFGGDRLFFNLRGGIQFHNLVGDEVKNLSASVFDLVSNGSSERLSVDHSSVQVETIQDNFIEAGLGFGVNYALSKSIDIGVEPAAYKAITPMFDQKPWSFGMVAGITIRVDPSKTEDVIPD